MIVEWKTLAEKKPERERPYAITVEGIFDNVITGAMWWKGHFWKSGTKVDTLVIAWADGLEPYEEERRKH